MLQNISTKLKSEIMKRDTKTSVYVSEKIFETLPVSSQSIRLYQKNCASYFSELTVLENTKKNLILFPRYILD